MPSAAVLPPPGVPGVSSFRAAVKKPEAANGVWQDALAWGTPEFETISAFRAHVLSSFAHLQRAEAENA
jgi:hypothetical protein